ncbi:hypothetical protein SUGI_0592190 [Cryptomeria japonica]|uniref:uncharacterized protein LOC131030561 n=1 Tax=Cryptomeria japonica TaxID=3369 RepID=UPI00241484A0|nr:uncharacterized protein LOC131030561 [Cryptomeria japonica]GLJ29953.1 hypothetical protein SUGI_0592190 [Cryptomeria japonica]
MMKNTGKIPLVGMCIIFAILLNSLEGRPSNYMHDVNSVQDISIQSPATGGDISAEPIPPGGGISALSEPVGGDISAESEPVGGDISALSEPVGGDMSAESAPPGGDISALSEPVGGDISAESEPPPLPQVSGLIFPVPCVVTQFIRLSCTNSTNANTQITEFCTCTVA